MKIHQTFRLDEEVVKKAKKLASDESRSISNFYAMAVTSLVLMKESLKPKRK